MGETHGGLGSGEEQAVFRMAKCTCRFMRLSTHRRAVQFQPPDRQFPGVAKRHADSIRVSGPANHRDHTSIARVG